MVGTLAADIIPISDAVLDIVGVVDAMMLGLTLALSDITGVLNVDIIPISNAVLDMVGVEDAMILA